MNNPTIMSNPSPAVDENTFTLFKKPPPELRLQIWEMILPGSRVLTVRTSWIRHWPRDPYKDYIISKDANNVVSLYVCRESRNITLRKYHFCFEGLLRQPIYFNTALDVLKLDDSPALVGELLSRLQDIPQDRLTQHTAPVRVAALPPIGRLHLFRPAAVGSSLHHRLS